MFPGAGKSKQRKRKRGNSRLYWGLKEDGTHGFIPDKPARKIESKEDFQAALKADNEELDRFFKKPKSIKLQPKPKPAVTVVDQQPRRINLDD